MNPKPVSASLTQQVQIIMPQYINGAHRLFGGRLMEWIDVVAGVTARRHAGCDVTTASVGRLDFLAPAALNDTILLEGRVTWTGRTSMEVRVDTFVEGLDGKRQQVNRAYLILVAIDPEGRPTPVPPLELHTPEEYQEWSAALVRKEAARQQTLY